jgi:RNA polymerase sigma factor (sigma-70 family)
MTELATDVRPHLRLLPTPAPESTRAPEPRAWPPKEIQAVEDMHAARVRVWELLLASPGTLPQLRANGVTLEAEEIAGSLERLRGRAANTDVLEDIARVAQWLALEDRGLDWAQAVVAHGGCDRAVDAVLARFGKIRSRFAAMHMGLVRGLAHRFCGRGVDREDLVQEGTIGLLDALGRYDHTRGVRFSTYATWWIRNALTKLVCGGRVVRVPAHARRAQARWIRLQEDARRRGETAPTTAALSAEGLSARIVSTLSRLPTGGVQSVDPQRELPGAGDDCSHLEGTDAHVEHEMLMSTLARSMEALSARETLVLERRFGLNGHEVATLTEVGRALSVSAERVRQIEKAAVSTLRQALLALDPELPLADAVTGARGRRKAA